MSTVQEIGNSLLQGDWETIEFTAVNPDGSEWNVGAGTVLFTADLGGYGRLEVISKNSTDDPDDFNFSTGEVDGNGNAIHYVYLSADDLSHEALTRGGELFCDIVLRDAQSRDATSRFKVKVELRATPVDA